jgi:peptidoglycan/xylan/chitin deacetylase (PgdA/CDA1 family)
MPPTTVCFTVDVEPDCPPYLSGFRGIEEGMPRLLAMLSEERVPGTFFTTGEVAQRYPGVVRAIVSDGHELACHGMTHRAFTSMTHEEARGEIEESAKILRRHAPVTSFRAPYLRFPDRYVPLLEASGFGIDSSGAKYKWREAGSGRREAGSGKWEAGSGKREAGSGKREAGSGKREAGELKRIPASVTSSVLRLPRLVRETYLRALGSPVVLFVHPWEFVDLRRERLRIDCRFRTGDIALACVRDVIQSFAARGANFSTMRDLSAEAA